MSRSIIFKPRVLVAFILVLFLTFSLVPANATETTNPYLDDQAEVHYVLYQPVYSSSLPLLLDALEPNCHPGVEKTFAATYGRGKRFFTLAETSSKTTCAMNMMLIRGATRTVVNKPGIGRLAGTQVVFVSVGVSKSEMKKIVSSLKPTHKS